MDTMHVSMPYRGLVSFLLEIERPIDEDVIIVSMPYRGLVSFLLSAVVLVDDSHEKCQCPIAGWFHFYWDEVSFKSAEANHVSMPYRGLVSFLQRR